MFWFRAQTMMFDFDSEVDQALAKIHTQRPVRSGTLVRLVGLRLEARGIMAPVGACCEVIGQSGKRIEAEVVGFADSQRALDPPQFQPTSQIVRTRSLRANAMRYAACTRDAALPPACSPADPEL